ncbi:N-6 DNA methylase [Aliarcobacter butzleri]|uniref:Eco57I restriction-modification methylase domain-containing protein n=1 Tax=Aliarcobacter butzleri TaxID=28197 RepID=UPI00263EE5DE|nr:N-6 DNA methylase [Aliarcobacter butzleri]MDN5100351.1 N-6 DNA methylase [Aliarcobacter butzleri]
MFQKSVLNSIKQDESLIALRWAEYQKFLTKVEYIKTVKEEKYQDGFLKDIFENCLGYTLDMTDPSNFNLEREKKNETDGKKADGVIYVDKKIVGVIELKAQDTKNLDKIEAQAFNYHNSHSNSKYVIISNFDELRFYIDKKTAYEKFSLFNLDYEEFKKLHLLISFESIKNDIPLKLKEKTSNFEQNISKELYKDFSVFRNTLFENIVNKNPDIEKSTLLRLTQKLCDRIIFILFAEDRGLLTSNTISEIRQKHSQDGFGDRSMYDYYKHYFKAINEGNERLNIPKYNGGLFSKDDLLDSLIIDDSFLDMKAQKLSDYDFESDISVNILGHIFEQSLTDLEELQANIENTDFDKTKSKRKKDGVFYTPEYITKYIVDNTLGKMCNDKREELNLLNITAPVNLKKLTKAEQQTKDNLEVYKDWLFNLKILDPACGSGAFLNQALEYLIKEHKQLQNDLALIGDLFSSYTVEESVLEHNLYGVDINEDAVEIAKLSLWLRTAQRGRALTNLNDKIVCANSLLEMPFSENSFDVVIGNPPYVRQEMIKEIKPQLQEKYITYTSTSDLYVYFYELSYRLLKQNGLNGFICSNKFFRAKYGEVLRDLILKEMTIKTIVDFTGKKVFEDATADSAITIFEKSKSNNNSFNVVSKELDNSYEMKQSNLTKSYFAFTEIEIRNIHQKIETKGIKLKNWNLTMNMGIKTGFNEAFIIDEAKRNEFISKDKKNAEILKPILRGRDIKKYGYEFGGMYIINIHNNPPVDIENYPIIKEHLNQYFEILEKRSDKGITPYNLRNCAFLNDFEKEKIIWLELSDKSKFTIENEHYTLAGTFIMTGESLKYLLAFFNSKLIEWYFDYICNSSGVGTNQWKKVFVEQIPIPKIEEEEQQPFIKFVDEILEAKQKIKDYKILLDEAMKNDNFDREIKLKKELETLENICNSNEKEIDGMVYKLYDLTEDEIKIVESK